MNLVISVRFLDFLYHGLTANGEKPEWPPSPFRLFQALVAGSGHGSSLPASIVEALSWLESLEAPLILAPQGFPAQPVQSFVLNNTKGRSRTSKVARPTIMNDPPLVRYVWQFSDESKEKLAMAHAVASSATHIRILGWGINMAVGNGEVINALKSDGLRAVEYHPARDASKGLEMRVPTKGSLESLQRNYAQYLGRFTSEESTELESGGALTRCSHIILAPLAPTPSSSSSPQRRRPGPVSARQVDAHRRDDAIIDDQVVSGRWA